MKNIHSLYINGYKCFGKEKFVGFEQIKRMNILIGRNNTGKSSLMDILTFVTDPTTFVNNRGTFEQVVVGYKLDEEIIKRNFSSSVSGGSIPYNHYDYGLSFVGKVFHVELTIQHAYSDRVNLTGIYTTFKNEAFPSHQKEHWDKLARDVVNEVTAYSVFRLGAERNIVPEEESKDWHLSINGDGATDIIHKFINRSTLDSKLVENKLLHSLNAIIHPDVVFTDIVVQQVLHEDSYKWEIFLEEENKGRIPLSKSGSGLKTIILVLIQFLLMPVLYERKTSEIMFALEELENNLHPALQRNLFKFMYDWANENDTTIFITTHSHIPINMFSGIQDVQIIHLRNVDNEVIPKVTLDFLDSSNILQDLDVKASDLLQSNGIIWVEGPSDRLYINKWIELFSNGMLHEGIHYQIVYYGGRLLAHFTADHGYEEKELVNLLLANRNCAIVIDSDKRTRGIPINNTKKRIKEEFENIDLIAWITKGKEIENYIPESIIKRVYSKDINDSFTQYMNIKDFLEKLEKGEGVRYERNKVAFAKKIIPYLNKEELEKTLDLKQKINEIIKHIRKWNSL